MTGARSKETIADEVVLAAFREREGMAISGEELSRRLGISRTAIWKRIEHLRHEGYRIEAHPHLGYRLTGIPDAMIAAELSWRLETKLIGRRILSYHVLDSTNDTAYQLAEQGIPEGTVVCAEAQRKGRGRLGRRWASPGQTGIYLSCVLRPAIAPQEAAKLTLLSAVAAHDAIRSACGLDVTVKWPNDIFVDGRKLCGILVEMKAEQDRVDFVVIGIGINVNTPARDLPAGATSLKIELKKRIGRLSLAQAFLRALDGQYDTFLRQGFAGCIDTVNEISCTTDRLVRVRCHDRIIEGRATHIESDGGLVVRTAGGLCEKIYAGDVVIVR